MNEIVRVFKRSYSSGIPKEFTHQGHLEKVIHEIFHDKHILRNVKREANIISPKTGSYLELDIWIPELKLAFEFQDPHHYATTWYSQLTLEHVQQIDKAKKKAMSSRGETLITVPCWWDNNKDSLIATIKLYRNELFCSYSPSSPPISPEPPAGYFRVTQVPGVGELMIASFADHHSLREHQGWWMSEKYDGVRACWNPSHNTLYSRIGKAINVPKSFLKHFPPDSLSFLDGEIWFGRGMHPSSVRVLSRKKHFNLVTADTENNNSENFDEQIEWPYLLYVVFDSPSFSPSLLPPSSLSPLPSDFSSSSVPYEDRMFALLSVISEIHPFVEIAAQIKNRGEHEIILRTQEIVSHGGEGLVLRKNKSFYEHGRSISLQKYKAARQDQEALVLDPEIIDGRIRVRLQSGDIIVAKLSTSYTGPLPNRGSVVTISSSIVSVKGNIGDARVERVREDVVWSDANTDSQLSMSEITQRALAYSGPVRERRGYWTEEEGKNVRKFFEDFAKSKDIDPLVPENWYPFLKSDYLSQKGASTLFKNYQNSAVKALLDAFPDIGIRVDQFRHVTKRHWQNENNRRRVFDEIAANRGFDPLEPSHWYSFTTDDIQKEKGGHSVLSYYSFSLSKALMSLYPKVGFVLSKFRNSINGYWKSKENRRNFFDRFAQSKGFDPLNPSNWYIVGHDDISAAKGGGTILHMYKSSLMKALIDLYPDIQFDQSKFSIINRKTYHMSHIRKSFDKFALERGLDPLLPRCWYNISPSMIKDDRACSIVVDFRYNGSVVMALMDVYPTIGLDPSKFTNTQLKNSWRLEGSRRLFFDTIAKENGFDTLNVSGWETITIQNVLDKKGGRRILEYHNGSLQKALKDLYGIDVPVPSQSTKMRSIQVKI